MQTRFCIFSNGEPHRRRTNLLAGILPALLSVGLMSAQVGGSGTIQGTVTDPLDAIIPNASVTATNLATGIQTARLRTMRGSSSSRRCNPANIV
jgi:hypothetical protein